ncbi:MAG TPA: hypothetical protein PK280_04670 [Planctomycetota bacterium]|nr:hypothetical protein [Planctomycetota bacterium]
MRLALTCSLAWLLAAAAPLAGEAPPAFTAKPAVAKAGDRFAVNFTVSAPTDVEVAVLDAGGKVVRHLAAGVLGGKEPPPEPLKAGLAQALEWDLKDDAGKPAAGGPFKVRVKLGLRAELDGFLAEKTNWIGDLSGLAVGPNGELFVYSSTVFSHRGHSRCMSVYSREGKYLRTIMPPPANLPKEKLLPFNTTMEGREKVVLDVPGDDFQPRNYYGTWPEFYSGPMAQLAPRPTADGRLLLMYYAACARLETTGAAADASFWRPFWKANPSGYTASKGALVPSPDGKWLYLVGVRSAKEASGKETDLFPAGRIYRMGAGEGALMEKFVDLPAGKTSFHGGPQIGGDCDKDGNLLVCDWGGNKLRTFSPDGKELDALAVDAPELVACHRKTGAVYVLSAASPDGKRADRKLLKFSSGKADAKRQAELAIPFRDTYIYYQETSSISLALDDEGETPIVWVGQAHGHPDAAGRKPAGVLRIEDRGAEFKPTLDLIDLERNPPAIMPRMAVHPDTDVLVYNDGCSGVAALNGLTGAAVKLPFANATDMGVGLDGNWYVQTGAGYSGPICRFDRDFKPLPVAGKTPTKDSPDNGLCDVYGRMGAGYCSVGLAVDGRGRLFSLQMYDFGAYNLAVFGPDGKPEDPGRMKDDPRQQKCPRYKSAVVGPIAPSTGGVQVDWQGNIYLGVKILPKGYKPPAGFEGARSGYAGITGCVVKFGPKGGAVHGMQKAPPEGLKGEVVDLRWGFMSPVNYQAFVEEPLKFYPGLGCISGGFGDGCACRQPMFQVDGWGRIFYPSAATCSVKIVDNAGNLIQEFGRYGNIDSRGPGKDSLVKKPDVPLGWPQSVGASDKAVYVSDVANRRIVRMKKVYAAEESCEVK